MSPTSSHQSLTRSISSGKGRASLMHFGPLKGLLGARNAQGLELRVWVLLFRV